VREGGRGLGPIIVTAGFRRREGGREERREGGTRSGQAK